MDMASSHKERDMAITGFLLRSGHKLLSNHVNCNGASGGGGCPNRRTPLMKMPWLRTGWKARKVLAKRRCGPR